MDSLKCFYNNIVTLYLKKVNGWTKKEKKKKGKRKEKERKKKEKTNKNPIAYHG